MKGAHWLLLGVLLLIVMFVGARWVFPPSNASGGNNKSDSPGAADQKVVCWGFFENEKGVANLTPKQYGDIIEIVPDNSLVKKGNAAARTRLHARFSCTPILRKEAGQIW